MMSFKYYNKYNTNIQIRLGSFDKKLLFKTAWIIQVCLRTSMKIFLKFLKSKKFILSFKNKKFNSQYLLKYSCKVIKSDLRIITYMNKKKKRYTVIRSPHVYKHSYEHFGIKRYTCLISIKIPFIICYYPFFWKKFKNIFLLFTQWLPNGIDFKIYTFETKKIILKK